VQNRYYINTHIRFSRSIEILYVIYKAKTYAKTSTFTQFKWDQNQERNINILRLAPIFIYLYYLFIFDLQLSFIC